MMTPKYNPAQQLARAVVMWKFSHGAGMGFAEYLALQRCHVSSAARLGCAVHCLSICLMLLGKQERIVAHIIG